MSTSNERKSKRDHGLLIAVAIVVAVAIVASVPIVISMANSGKYKEFVSRYTDAINSSHTETTVRVTIDGEDIDAPLSNASRVYSIVLAAGMGKAQKNIPEGNPVIISFKDGSQIELREAQITEKSALRENGLFVRFTGTDGYVYQYDTDKLSMDSVRSAFPGR